MRHKSEDPDLVHRRKYCADVMTGGGRRVKPVISGSDTPRAHPHHTHLRNPLSSANLGDRLSLVLTSERNCDFQLR